MKLDWRKNIGYKKIASSIGVLIIALMVAALFYLKLLDYYEKEFDLTNEMSDAPAIVLLEGEKIEQQIQFTINEVSATSVKISKEQENLDDIELVISVYDDTGVLIKDRVYTEADIVRDGQLYIHFDQVLNPGNYIVTVEVIDKAETDASLQLLSADATGQTLVVKQSNFAWSNDYFRTLSKTIIVILSIAVIWMAFLVFSKKVAFHWSYFFAALVFGIIFMFIIPPYSVPDEQTHISVSLYLSSDWLGWDKYQSQGASFVGRQTEFDNGYSAYLSRDVYNNYLNKLFLPVSESGNTIVDSYHELASPLSAYVVPAIGITIGRLLSLNGTMTILLGRIFNLIFFISLVTYAIKKVPFGKMIIAGVCLLPMTLQQASSYSYDNALISAGVVTTALGIRWCYTEEKVKKNEIILYLIATFILLVVKGGVYCTIAFLPLIYKMSKKKLNLIWSKYRIQSIFFIVASVGVLLRNKIISIVNGLFVSAEPEVIGTAVESAGNIIKWTGTEGYTVGELLMNPVELIRIVLNTFLVNIDWYWGTMIGQSLGWFEISIPWLVIFVCTLILLIATIKPMRENGELVVQDKLFASGFSIISCGLCMAAMLLLWTPKGSSSILGVQGRYFLPVAATLLFGLRTKKLQIEKNIDRVLLYVMFLVDVYVVFHILNLLK